MNVYEVLFKNQTGGWSRSHFCSEKDKDFWISEGYRVIKRDDIK